MPLQRFAKDYDLYRTKWLIWRLAALLLEASTLVNLRTQTETTQRSAVCLYKLKLTKNKMISRHVHKNSGLVKLFQ